MRHLLQLLVVIYANIPFTPITLCSFQSLSKKFLRLIPVGLIMDSMVKKDDQRQFPYVTLVSSGQNSLTKWFAPSIDLNSTSRICFPSFRHLFTSPSNIPDPRIEGQIDAVPYNTRNEKSKVFARFPSLALFNTNESSMSFHKRWGRTAMYPVSDLVTGIISWVLGYSATSPSFGESRSPKGGSWSLI